MDEANAPQDQQDPSVNTDADNAADETEEVETPILNEEEAKHRERVIRLLNSSGHKGGFTPKDFKEFLEAASDNVLGDISKAQLRKYATGEERTPKALGDKLADALEERNVPERGRRWARGMAAIVLTMPKQEQAEETAEQEPDAEPEQPQSEPETADQS